MAGKDVQSTHTLPFSHLDGIRLFTFLAFTKKHQAGAGLAQARGLP